MFLKGVGGLFTPSMTLASFSQTPCRAPPITSLLWRQQSLSSYVMCFYCYLGQTPPMAPLLRPASGQTYLYQFDIPSTSVYKYLFSFCLRQPLVLSNFLIFTHLVITKYYLLEVLICKLKISRFICHLCSLLQNACHYLWPFSSWIFIDLQEFFTCNLGINYLSVVDNISWIYPFSRLSYSFLSMGLVDLPISTDAFCLQ